MIHNRMNANFAEYDGWSLPKDFGNPSAETEALHNGCAAFDLSSFGRITLKGDASHQLLASLVPSAALPAEGKWLWADFDSKHPSSLRIAKVNGNFLILTLPRIRQRVLEAAGQIADQTPINNVLITDITEKTGMLGIYGPRAVEAVNNVLPFDVSAISEEEITNMSFFMISITILRGAWTGGDGMELLCPVSAAAMAAGALAKYHERENITAAGMDCLLGNMK